MEESLTLLMSGAMVAAYAVAALFFARFWSDTRERLFAYFAAAFVLLAIQRLALSFVADDSELAPLLYLLRLVAFLVILAAIVDKNRAG